MQTDFNKAKKEQTEYIDKTIDNLHLAQECFSALRKVVDCINEEDLAKFNDVLLLKMEKMDKQDPIFNCFLLNKIVITMVQNGIPSTVSDKYKDKVLKVSEMLAKSSVRIKVSKIQD